MAEALVADDWAEAYFRQFPALSGLEVRTVRRIRPETFLTVLRLMLASPDQDFVIDAHGEPRGLFMTLAGGRSVGTVEESLRILMRLRHAREAMARASDNLDAWRRILRTYSIPPQRATEVDEAREAARVWERAQVDGLGVTAAQANELLRLMTEVRTKGVRRIEFRSCNMGKRPQTLAEFRRFFGARHVGAPDVRSGFGYATPVVSRRGVDVLAGRGAEVFAMSSGRFALRVDIQAGTVRFDTQCATDSQQAVRDWVSEHLMPRSRYRRGRLPIHVLETDPRTFSLDAAYRGHIKHASGLWWIGRVYEEERPGDGSFSWERAAARR
jgi:hypothetical protein